MTLWKTWVFCLTLISGVLSAEFTGQVTYNQNGLPIQDGRISLIRWSTSGETFLSYTEEYTDENGNFAFDNVEIGEYRLYILAEGYSVFTDLNFSIDDNILTNFQLSSSVEGELECSGRILNSSQQEVGIPGATISKWIDGINQGFWEVISVTDEFGDYQFFIDPSEMLYINALGYAPIELTANTMENALNDIYLDPFAFDGSISGFITDEFHSRDIPLANLTVYSTPADSTNSPAIYSITSDELGYYSLENIPNGEATIFVSAEGYEGYFNTVNIQQNTVHNININVLPEMGKISGYVTIEETGESVSTESDQTYIEFIPVSNSYHWIRANIWSDGRYWANLPEGDYIVACFQGSLNEIGGEKLVNHVYFHPETQVLSEAVPLTVEDGILIDNVDFSIHAPSISVYTNYYSDLLGGHLEYYLGTGLAKIKYLLVAPPAEPEPGDIGDEIGILDYNGIPETGDCTGMEGQVLVGAAPISNDQSTIVIPVFEYINECASSGMVTAGYVEGNTINLNYWDASMQTETILDVEFSYGSFAPDSGGISNPALFGNQYTFVNVTTFPTSEQQVVSLEFSEGWNLVGLPLLTGDLTYNSVFPYSINETCFSYQSGSYAQTENLDPGAGYWLRFPESRGGNITGYTIHEINIPLTNGWNLVSSITQDISVTSVIDPDNVLVPNAVYGFSSNGYENVSDFHAGCGYWILSTGNGTITISDNNSGKLIDGSTQNQNTETSWLRVNGSKLYFGKDLTEEELLSYRLPPKPPAGAFDVRFRGETKYSKGDGIIEIMNPTDGIRLDYSMLDGESWKITGDNGEELILSGVGRVEFEGDVEEIVLEKLSVLPEKFALHQNYPNPFNPKTTISFSLPLTASELQDVTLKVYDVRGCLVRTLFSGSLGAGYHQVDWDGTDTQGHSVASGMYLYQLISDQQNSTRKLLHLK